MQNLLASRQRSFSWLWGVVGLALGGALVWSASQPWFPIKLSLNIRLPKQYFISPQKDEPSKKDKSTISSVGYTAVYLDTDQVFYGRLKQQSGQYLVLTDVFYYQPGIRAASPGSIRIIKLGTELHKPKDEVSINRSHIVTIEQLSEASKVTQAILKYKTE